ncbi:unnamed protein product [Durusdinium trenchii]|uniref:GP-PDE domain-containing protein n=1 Tax=Durusdinium trenchii TaxID=1381693 RepID=A0ABP0K611_9DINO
MRFFCYMQHVVLMEAAYSTESAWLNGFVPQICEKLRERLVAHRGFHCPLLSSDRPLECTKPALKIAWDSGLRYCECDVRLSSDGKIMLLHDPNLDKLVEESAKPTPNANEITAEDLISWPLLQKDVHLTYLEDVLLTALESGSRLVIELKGSPGSPTVGSAVARLLQGNPQLLEACALVMSFEVPELLGFADAWDESIAETSRPKLLLLTAIPRENLEAKYQTLDLGDSAWPEKAATFLARKDLLLDGFYIEWTEKLSNDNQEALRKLCHADVCSIHNKVRYIP